VERIYSSDEDVEEVDLGLYVIRGDNLCLVGEFDETKLKDDQRVPEPIKPVLQHVQF
jgi:U6 snRNA-associated Sm-like protein LSm8